MSLLIDSPSSFATLLEKELGDAQLLVLIELFDRLERKFKRIDLRNIAGYSEEWHKAHPRHNYLHEPHGCGCELCKMLGEYSRTRIIAHRLGRTIETYCTIYPMVALQDSYKTEREMLQKAALLRTRRKEVLSELGLIKHARRYVPA